MIVCFDIGGVLVRICRSWEEGCRAAEVPARRFDPEPGHLERRGSLLEDLQRGEIEDEEFHRRLSDLLDGVWSADEVRRIDSAWLLDPYPGTLEIVKDLHAAGVPTTCLSNTSAGHWKRLVEYDNVAGLGSRHASHLMGLAKPDPRIYAEFESRMDVRPQEILFFDDLQPNVDAAIERGWNAIRVDHAGDTASQIRTTLTDRGLL